MVNDDLASDYTDPMFYFVDLTKPYGDPDQVISYPIAFGVIHPDHSVSNEDSFHDIYFGRSPDGNYTFNYGPISVAAEPVFFEAPLDGDSSKVSLWYDNYCTDGIPYHSHPAWAYWRRLFNILWSENFL